MFPLKTTCGRSLLSFSFFASQLLRLAALKQEQDDRLLVVIADMSQINWLSWYNYKNMVGTAHTCKYIYWINEVQSVHFLTCSQVFLFNQELTVSVNSKKKKKPFPPSVSKSCLTVFILCSLLNTRGSFHSALLKICKLRRQTHFSYRQWTGQWKQITLQRALHLQTTACSWPRWKCSEPFSLGAIQRETTSNLLTRLVFRINDE